MSTRLSLVLILFFAVIAFAEFPSCKKAGDGESADSDKSTVSNGQDSDSKPAGALNPDGLFVLYSYDTNGKMETCGCASLQLGGLARRGTLFDDYVNNYGRHVLVLDGGKILPDLSEFSRFKAEVLFKLMNQMRYDAMKLGSYEYGFDNETLSKWADFSKFPFVSSNVLSADAEFGPLVRKAALDALGSDDVTTDLDAGEFYKSVTGKAHSTKLNWTASPVLFVHRGNFRIGIVAATEPSWIENLGPETLVTMPMRDTLKHLVTKYKDKADVWVALIEGHGSSIQSMAPQLPEIRVWLSGNPRYGEAHVAKTDLGAGQHWMNIFQDGKYIGVTSLDKNDEGFLISQKEVAVQDTVKERSDLLAVMVNDYRPKLEGIFRNSTQPMGKEYVYSIACQKCHVEEYKKYISSHHSMSLRSLEGKGQQWNPDCISCHMEYDSVNDRALSMQCTTCHYNSWENHMKEARENPAAVTPLGESITFEYCSKCHDEENSPEFSEKYRDYFAKIKHWKGPTVPGEPE